MISSYMRNKKRKEEKIMRFAKNLEEALRADTERILALETKRVMGNKEEMTDRQIEEELETIEEGEELEIIIDVK